MTELRQQAVPAVTIGSLLDDWAISLRAQAKSPLTVLSYRQVAESLGAYLAEKGMPQEVSTVHREHVESWLADMHNRLAPATVARHYRSAQQLFRWLVEEGEIEASPMARMHPPKVPRKNVPVLSDEDVKKLLAACPATTFEGRRDAAVIRMLLDTGCRASELIGLRVQDVDLARGMAQVVGKGGDERTVALGPKTSEAVRRYLRMRTRTGRGAEEALWLGKKGKLSDSGLRQMLERRGKDAGVEGLHPHRFRHTFVHRWLSAGGSEGDLMMLGGWRSSQMIQQVYGRSAAAARAVEAHRRLHLNEV